MAGAGVITGAIVAGITATVGTILIIEIITGFTEIYGGMEAITATIPGVLPTTDLITPFIPVQPG